MFFVYLFDCFGQENVERCVLTSTITFKTYTHSFLPDPSLRALQVLFYCNGESSHSIPVVD